MTLKEKFEVIKKINDLKDEIGQHTLYNICIEIRDSFDKGGIKFVLDWDHLTSHIRNVWSSDFANKIMKEFERVALSSVGVDKIVVDDVVFTLVVTTWDVNRVA